MGEITAASGGDDGRELRIATPPGFADGLDLGDSVAVEGVCLTAIGVSADHFSVHTILETLHRSTLGSLEVGSKVNLERAMPATGRFEGHIVQGHVDGIGTVTGITPEGEGQRLRIDAPRSVLGYVVEKGSITINGVSLTVTALDDTGFEVALIPHTLAMTTLGTLGPGSRVNLEADILAKYVERLLERR